MRTLLHSPSSVLSGRRPDGARAGALTWSRRWFVHGLSVASVALLADCRPFSSPAQQPQKIARIGFLSVGPGPPEPGTRPNTQAFRQALREQEYVEGHNVLIEYRYADPDGEEFPALVAELVRLPVDVIVAAGPEAVQAAKMVATIPIVMVVTSDPVETGLVASFARPGGNVTGMTTRSRALS